jgi:hypothetical protein
MEVEYIEHDDDESVDRGHGDVEHGGVDQHSDADRGDVGYGDGGRGYSDANSVEQAKSTSSPI